jgi:hypothetical protein
VGLGELRGADSTHLSGICQQKSAFAGSYIAQTGPNFPVSLAVILCFFCSHESGAPNRCGPDESWREMYQRRCHSAFASGAPGDFDSGIGAGRALVVPYCLVTTLAGCF